MLKIYPNVHYLSTAQFNILKRILEKRRRSQGGRLISLNTKDDADFPEETPRQRDVEPAVSSA